MPQDTGNILHKEASDNNTMIYEQHLICWTQSNSLQSGQ